MGRRWKRKMERVELRGWVDRVAMAGGEKVWWREEREVRVGMWGRGGSGLG